MEQAEVELLCAELIAIIKRGPSKDEGARSRVQAIISSIERASDRHTYVHEKAFATIHDFDIW